MQKSTAGDDAVNNENPLETLVFSYTLPARKLLVIRTITTKRNYSSAESRMKMNNTPATSTGSSLADASASSPVIDYSKAEGIAWCSAFILTSLLVIVGNMITIVLFAANKTLRKKSLYLVINMAFADLMLGAVSMPSYIFYIGAENFHLWTARMPKSLDVASDIFEMFFMHASLISAAMIAGERFLATYSPYMYKRTLTKRTHRFVISMLWILTALLIAFESGLVYLTTPKNGSYVWIAFGLTITLIICGCNVGICKKFKQGAIAFQLKNRALRSKRLTKTLLFVSVLALLSWLPLIIMDALENMFGVKISAGNFYFTVNLLNYSNFFVNPVVYVFRIPEFRQALCCFKRQAVTNMKGSSLKRERRSDYV